MEGLTRLKEYQPTEHRAWNAASCGEAYLNTEDIEKCLFDYFLDKNLRDPNEAFFPC